MTYHVFPVIDMCAPDDPEQARRLVETIAQQYLLGRNILVHCRYAHLLCWFTSRNDTFACPRVDLLVTFVNVQDMVFDAGLGLDAQAWCVHVSCSGSASKRMHPVQFSMSGWYDIAKLFRRRGKNNLCIGITRT